MIVGIVGSEAAKFTTETELHARKIIETLLLRTYVTGFCSGHCHLGGVDIWTEEIGNALCRTPYIFPPKTLSWDGGYKQRNILIAEQSDEVHCITLARLPDSYNGMKFERCYHCNTDTHVKSGGCWTAKYAKKLGKRAVWHVIG